MEKPRSLSFSDFIKDYYDTPSSEYTISFLNELISRIERECPQCHHGPNLKFDMLTYPNRYKISCMYCGCSTGEYDNLEVAVDAWNGEIG